MPAKFSFMNSLDYETYSPRHSEANKHAFKSCIVPSNLLPIITGLSEDFATLFITIIQVAIYITCNAPPRTTDSRNGTSCMLCKVNSQDLVYVDLLCPGGVRVTA